MLLLALLLIGLLLVLFIYFDYDYIFIYMYIWLLNNTESSLSHCDVSFNFGNLLFVVSLIYLLGYMYE